MPDLNRHNLLELLARLSAERAALAVLAADMQGDPKKQGKEKKPDGNLVIHVFPV
jgi:hypothetical protein